MPAYRALRARHGFLELCKNPELAAEVTLQPVEELGVDAAILFADILLVVEPLGVGLEFAKGEGPVIHRPIRSMEAVAKLRPVDVESEVGFVFETVRRVRHALAQALPLIGFAGAPSRWPRIWWRGDRRATIATPSASCTTNPRPGTGS